MSTATTLKALIAQLLTGGCYNNANTSETITLPYAVFYEIVSVPTDYIHGGTAITERDYQIDVFARTPEQAEGLSLSTIKDAIVGSSLEGRLTRSMSGEYDPITKTYQYTTEYTIWET